MSTIKVNSIQNTSGVEVYTAKAWVNFNGTGTVAIRASGNVSSITDNGVGDYTVNLTSPMPDALYCVAVGGHASETTAAAGRVTEPYSLTVNSFRIATASSSAGAVADNALVFAAVFR